MIANTRFPLCLLLFTAVTAWLPGASWSVPCENYAQYCSWVGGNPLNGISNGVDVAGNLAFVASGSTGLRLLDISDPSRPTLLSTANTPGYAEHVAVGDGVAFVADQAGGLQVIDVSPPGSPHVIGSHATLGHARDVCLADNLAFVAVDDAGLQIFDVVNPASPQLLASLDLPGSARGVCIEENLVFVGLFTDGFAVVDVSTPSTPALMGVFDTPGSVWDLAAKGTTLFIPDHSEGLRVYDVSDPSTPSLEYHSYTGGFAVGVALMDDRLYVADNWQEGVIIFDITSPTSPTRLAFVASGGGSREIALTGGHAFIATYDNGIQVVDISRQESALPTLGYFQPDGSVSHLVGFGSTLYVANNSQFQFQVFDVSDPSTPEILGSVGTNHSFNDMVVHSDLVFTAAGITGLQVFDVSDPQTPYLLSSLELPGNAVRLAVEGTLLFLLTQYDGLHIIDISTPADPVLLSSVSLTFIGTGLACQGDILYVLNGVFLRTLDVSDPAAPDIIDVITNDAEYYDIAIEDSIAYLCGHDSNPQVGFLKAFDLTNLRSPELISEIALPKLTWAVKVHQGFAYVANHDTGLHVVNIADPAEMEHIGSAVTPGYTKEVCILDGMVALTDGALSLFPVQCGEIVAPVEPTPGTNLVQLVTAPNPFNAATGISFSLAHGGPVTLAIHDLGGRLVSQLGHEVYGPGSHTVMWDGTDGAGRHAASGIYMVILKTPEGTAREKITLLK